MARARVIVIALAALALAGAALLWVDFHAARSETRANSQVTTLTSGSGEQALGQVPPGWTIALQVAGGGGIESRLRTSLPAEMERRPSIGEVRGLRSPDDPVDTPAMLVELTQAETGWTPVHATATVIASFVYASNGDLTWRNDESIGISNERGPTVLVKGEIKLSDTTSGVISLPAYQRKLGEALAVEVATKLENALAGAASRPAVAR
jgi:hypothetical protein